MPFAYKHGEGALVFFEKLPMRMETKLKVRGVEWGNIEPMLRGSGSRIEVRGMHAEVIIGNGGA